MSDVEYDMFDEIMQEEEAMKEVWEQKRRRDYDDYVSEAYYYGRTMSYDEFCEAC